MFTCYTVLLTILYLNIMSHYKKLIKLLSSFAVTFLKTIAVYTRFEMFFVRTCTKFFVQNLYKIIDYVSHESLITGVNGVTDDLFTEKWLIVFLLKSNKRLHFDVSFVDLSNVNNSNNKTKKKINL